MNLSTTLTLLLTLSLYLSFIWAVKRFFRVPTEGLPKPMKRLSGLGLLVMILNLWALAWPGNVEGWRGYAGFLILLGSLGLFWWAIRTNLKRPLDIAYTEQAPSHFVSEGPYRFLRHPFYTSYILGWLGGPVASAQYWLFVPALALTFLYYRAAMQEEGRFDRTPFSSSYQSYRKKTGMFFPKLF